MLRQIKAIFDPHGLFNPGKIVDPDPALASWPLRSLPTSNSPRSLSWPRMGRTRKPTTAMAAVNAEQRLRQRMCPIFRATHTEAATPRAKANLLRKLLQSGEPTALSSDQVRAVADLCVNCKMFAIECPAHVNIPKLMLEAKAANVAAHGLDRSEWFLARLEGFARLGEPFSPPGQLDLAHAAGTVAAAKTLRSGPAPPSAAAGPPQLPQDRAGAVGRSRRQGASGRV